MLCDSINVNFTFIVWQRKYKTCHSKQHDSKKKHICFLDSEALPIVWLKILTQEYSNMGLYLLYRIDETSNSVPWYVRIQSYYISSMKIKLSSNMYSDTKWKRMLLQICLLEWHVREGQRAICLTRFIPFKAFVERRKIFLKVFLNKIQIVKSIEQIIFEW